MTELEERLDRLVAHCIVPVLKPRGYRKKRLTWTRELSDAVHEVTLQRSHGNAPGHLRVYVEVAAYVPEFDRVIGKTVPASVASGTAQYQQRFESIVDWPAQWIDLEAWSEEDLFPRFSHAMTALADHLDGIDSAETIAAAKRASGAVLDTDLFAWSCATGDTAGRDGQFADALAEFGQEERWPRLRARFELVASRYGVTLPE